MMLLQGDALHLVDEWQLAPNLWDAARFDISHRGLIGQYIFTGSAVPPDISALQHSGTGRFARLTMRPMSLWESGESDGKISLKDIFEGEANPVATQGKALDELSFLICRGGWPGVLNLSEKSALLQARNYVDAVAQSDISRVDDISRNAELAYKLLRSYALHQGQAVPMTTITLDINVRHDSASTSEDTISSYISALNKIFVIEDMPAWNPNLRSKTAIRTSDNRYFIDTDKMNEPSFMMVLTGVGSYAYQTPEGVWVVPISCLKD